MERHRCKVCFRNFANGRALGGHMRSHTEEEDEDDENSKKSLDEAFCEDGEKRRSKRDRKSRVFYSDRFPVLGETNEHSALSSISDTSAEEDVAYCLMMLSRDKWEKGSFIAKKRGKFRCETCGKSFKSYQALGGHRASHTKAAAPPGGCCPVKVDKIHVCPFCDRVFASGQALGGHKRSHFIGVAAISGNEKFLTSRENLNIDLNQPAPVDDLHISRSSMVLK